MSHTSNWSPEKRAREAGRLEADLTEQERQRIAREVAAAKGAEPVAVVLRQSNGGDDLLRLHPCATHRRKMWVTATCAGCSAIQDVDFKQILTGPLAHALWSRVLRALVCKACGDSLCNWCSAAVGSPS